MSQLAWHELINANLAQDANLVAGAVGLQTILLAIEQYRTTVRRMQTMIG